MNQQIKPANQADQGELTPQEQRLVKTLRLLQQLDPSTSDQVERFVWSLVARHLKWSYSDPASVALALEFMALDPFLRQEVEAINADFAGTEEDGLGDY
jgi:hypothetical protein